MTRQPTRRDYRWPWIGAVVGLVTGILGVGLIHSLVIGAAVLAVLMIHEEGRPR